MQLILMLEEGVYFAEGHGDPPRTLVRKNAKIFTTTRNWNNALEKARQYRMFMNAQLINLDHITCDRCTNKLRPTKEEGTYNCPYCMKLHQPH